MNDTQVLLIEDDPVLGGALLQRLRLEGMRAQWVQSCAQAVEWFRRSRQRPAFVLADIRLPDGSGEDLYRRLIPYLAHATVVFATAYGDIAQAVRLVAAGANDYLTKPYDTDALVARMRAVIAAHPDGAAVDVRDNPFLPDDPESPLAHALERLAASALPLLLEGETGAGKDRAARYAHARSAFAAGPFVAVNCASVPEELAESLLFGHAKGAFSGAGAARDGFFQQAAEGTLYLDEVAELAPRAQSALLRVLENGEYRPLGDAASRRMGCRIMASASIDLEQAVAGRGFRADLYYRLAVARLALPPLRARPGAIAPLARALLDEQAQAGAMTLSADALHALDAHDWPGNVRELRNRIARAVVMADGAMLSASDLFPERRLAPAADLAALRGDAELRAIQRTIAETGGHLGEAAKKLGISRTTLWKKLRAAR
ncbi:sigma-54 dependent transcriptional regulator [Achromobacter xylosoxidans]|uniref:sigma-54-dependent transcriptional regulator n=2 Tax=Alcaligenes xylosoxydans xylosoxydans TaxID=85698 RepID=UPI00047BF56E|nr:sigma-54 dependent transcriptional regulator [Achromobacter xylosoxidans]KAA5926089.1 sigma-54-dependent Fis family transcriptional regulator [Achromobacter xylosoxidans]MCH4582914.1 sigma-54 dependent transcriptional regulator [Achromobacter xylosoxidans]MCZ8384697.1 sigma-54 dependent transcriptional regulator [Achromobacter xylosoxidans]MDZ5617162.1 sigma-54 dependent transcriptional regulator [Achromobacter xylosoxidans]MDZ5629587.1 sigma-54 dependent transcriptional regulator [Achromob